MNTASSSRPAPSSRTIISLIIQRSTIELFAAYDVSVAPLEAQVKRRLEGPTDRVVGTVPITSSSRRGLLTISTSHETLIRTRPTVGAPVPPQDWMRELTNQLAGRIKNRLGRYQLVLQIGLPTALGSSETDKEPEWTRTGIVCLFHTMRDDVRVALTGGFEEETLAFQSDGSTPDEGDVILF